MRLFGGSRVEDEGQHRLNQALRIVDQWDPDDLLEQDLPTFVAHVVEKYDFRTAGFRWDDATRSRVLEEPVMVQGYRAGRRMGDKVEITVPVEGDPEVLAYRGNPGPGAGFDVELEGGEIRFNVVGLPLSNEKVSEELERTRRRCEEYLAGCLGEAQRVNDRLAEQVRQRAEQRQRRLKEAADLDASIAIPIRRVNNTSSYPIAMRRRTILLPERTSSSPTNGREPVLDRRDFEQIIA